MATAFDDETYGQRWQVETVTSMLKRNLGTALTAHSDARRNQEMMLMVLTHNLAIIYIRGGFLQSIPGTFYSQWRVGVNLPARIALRLCKFV
ncbi:transposase [Poriferisphaera corsica]